MSSPSSPDGKDWDSLVAQVAWFGDGDGGSGDTSIPSPSAPPAARTRSTSSSSSPSAASAVALPHEQKVATPSPSRHGGGGGGGAYQKSASSPSAASAPRRRHSSIGIGITTLQKQHEEIMPHSPVHSSVAAPDMSQASQGIKIFLRVRPSSTPSGWFELDEHEGSIRCVRQRRRSCLAVLLL